MNCTHSPFVMRFGIKRPESENPPAIYYLKTARFIANLAGFVKIKSLRFNRTGGLQDEYWLQKRVRCNKLTTRRWEH